MSEPFLERLSRFTPHAGGLDRDSLLYAAGRASARNHRVWIALAAALAVTQPLSLILLWPRAVPLAANVDRATASHQSPGSARERSIFDSSESLGLWSVRHNLLDPEREDNDVPPDAVSFVESGPPLRAFAPPPPSILN
jgi:hypothetical protein